MGVIQTPPTLAGFTDFVRNSMGIGTGPLPDGSYWFGFCFELACLIVNRWFACFAPPIYTVAVYNLAADYLINYAVDQPAPPQPTFGDPPLPYFANLRRQYNTLGFVSGVINSASDEGTSESMTVQTAAEGFTLADIQNLKTPWGRTYLQFAQQFGPAAWGIS